MKTISRWQLGSFIFLCLIILSLLFINGVTVSQFTTYFPAVLEEQKQRGVHVFGPLEPDSTCLQPLIKNNVEWITLVPYDYQKFYDTPVLRGRSDSQRALRRDSSFRKKIAIAHQTGFKIMLKPHIWMSTSDDGKWRSDIFPKNEADWKTWSASYRAFIIHYAQMAEEGKVELFCVGTELSRLAKEKPAFWRKLIKEVRGIYSGPLTYAANWNDEFEKISFWDELDFIGVQAYFPLSKEKNPSTKNLIKGWKRHISILEKVHRRFNKPILFTEMGYKSTMDSAIEPWGWINHDKSKISRSLSTETQANCYEAFFKVVWPKKWFAGVHIWQWRNPHHRSGGSTDLNFTPQQKPAENIIAKGFGEKK